jgi:hypothetical protein
MDEGVNSHMRLLNHEVEKAREKRKNRRSAPKKNHGVSRREEEQHGEKKDL